jgi:hypothetical protein
VLHTDKYISFWEDVLYKQAPAETSTHTKTAHKRQGRGGNGNVSEGPENLYKSHSD